MLRTALWRHPWTIALLAALIGFGGELMLYTSEEGAAAMYALWVGVLAFAAALVLRFRAAHHHHGHRRGTGGFGRAAH